MTRTPAPPDEAQRLQRLQALGVLGPAPEPLLDPFTDLAASATGAPIALATILGSTQLWIKASLGLAAEASIPRDLSFCGHAVASQERLFEVEDARLDPRFHDHPAVTGAPGIRHYAAAVLVMPGGERIGTLSIADTGPGRLDARARALLGKLADAAVGALLQREQQRTLDARLQAERALREDDARFRAITDAVPQMVWSTLPDGNSDFHNQRWYDFTGLPEGSTRGRSWAEVLHADDRAQTLAGWNHSLATGEPYEEEFRLRHRSGGYRWVLGRALPLRGPDARIVRWLGTCTDIDEHKRAREELAASNRRKDEFLAMLAHELRNPLAPIRTAAELLERAADDPQQVRRPSERIGRQVTHMTALVDDLLDVSRVTRGLVQIAREPVDLQDVLRAALEQARPLLRARGHALSTAWPQGPVIVLGDRVRLVQVLANLLNNAAKYTPEGGQVALALRTESGCALVEVSDNGNGIDPQLLPHVFELFTQGRRTPDRHLRGLGLGLTLVRSLVQLHGGEVAAASAGPGHGSRFSLRLPLGEASAAPAPAPAPAASAATRALRVMVVDDNADAADLLGLWLETQGHRPVVQTDPLQALDAALAEPAEAYVLDIGLPGMDGHQLAQRLRADPRTRHATLIALSGYGQAQDQARSRAAGFDHHLVKPVRTEALRELLAEVAAAQPHCRAAAQSGD